MTETAAQPAYASTNPATGEVAATFDFATDAAIGEALAAGHRAFLDWRTLTVQERAALAKRIGGLFAERCDELAQIAVEEMGKPLGEAVEEVEFCQAIFDYYAEHGPDLAADQPITSFSGDQAVVEKRPIGLLLGVMPWNFPYYQVARFAAPNMVLGNTMLLKHAESVPRCAEAIQRLFDDAGVPAGVYQNVFATFGQVEQIIADPRVQGVSLTGSERAGSRIAALAGQHLKKCVLELGGSDPYVVLDADDVAAAATQAWETRIYNTGQACNSNKRMIVMDDVYEPFVARLTELAGGLNPGDSRRCRRGPRWTVSRRSWTTPWPRGRRCTRAVWSATARARTTRPPSSPASRRRCAPTARSSSARWPSSTRSPPTRRRWSWPTTPTTASAVRCSAPTWTGRPRWPHGSTSAWRTSTRRPARARRSRSEA